MKTIISTALLLSVVYLYLVYSISSEWSTMFGYSDSIYLLEKQLLYLLFGLITVAIFMRVKSLKSVVWFNRVGVSVFSLSLLMLLSMFFIPNSLAPIVDAQKLYIVLGGISIYPMLFFIFSIVWLLSYLHNTTSTKNLNLTIIGVVFLGGFFTLSFHDYGMFFLLELLLVFLLFHINGVSKYLFGTIIGIVLGVALFILTSPHRLSRLQSWMDSSDTITTQNPLSLSGLTLLTNNFGIAMSIFIVILFIFLIFNIVKRVTFNEKNKLFIVGIGSILAISLGLNLMSLFGFLPVNPPALFFFDYGLSLTVVSYLMIAMLGVLL
jgi:cell division protein FtsW (lipid II flippase)